MEDIIQKKYLPKWQNFLVVALFAAAIFSFLFFTDTLTSGYHLVDDHGMISIESSLEKDSFIKTVTLDIKKDLSIRFRPLYYVYYISEIEVFGLHFLALSIFAGILAVFSFYFFYSGMRNLGYSLCSSFLFVILAFLGPQSAIWWRLGTNETIGVFSLGLSFLFMTNCLRRERYVLNNIFFVIFLTITSLCKESFVIIIPAFVFFKVWKEKKQFNISIRESIRNNYPSLVPMAAMFAELLIIKYFVGTNKIGYAGVPSSASEFIQGLSDIVLGPISLLYWLVLIEVLLIFYFISFFFSVEGKRKVFQFVKYIFPLFFFSFLIVAPNMLMHAKSGMVERYLLPTTIGLSFFAVSLLQKTKPVFLKGLMLAAIFIFLSNSYSYAKIGAGIFASEGRQANGLLSSVMSHSNKDENILIVADPVDRFEVSWSAKTYLSYYGYKNIFVYPIMRKYTTVFEFGLRDQWLKLFEGKTLKDMDGKPDSVVFIYDRIDNIQLEKFFNESGISQLEYQNIIGLDSPHSVYVRK